MTTFPQKHRWTPEESLALIEVIEGTETIDGVPLPMYVSTRSDKVRWANCVRIAAQASGDPVASVLVQQTARILFSDHETYRDD